MPFKQFTLDENIQLTIYKRKGSRSLRLSLGHNGQIRVTIPVWAPYSAGLDFARARRVWILQNLQPSEVLKHGQSIGKAHYLSFVAASQITKPQTRLKTGQIVVTYPAYLGYNHQSVQQAAQKASIRALRQQAEQLLPQRLAVLATQYNFTYNQVSVKNLKRRWGSCDQNRNIVLNLHLMQLPWELIDYVLLHELAHTQVLRHGPDFWQTLSSVLPNAKQLRRLIRNYQPAISAQPIAMS